MQREFEMSKIRKSTGIGGVAAAALALLLGLTVGSPAYAVPSESSSVAESNQAAIDATLATIDDPAQRTVEEERAVPTQVS